MIFTKLRMGLGLALMGLVILAFFYGRSTGEDAATAAHLLEQNRLRAEHAKRTRELEVQHRAFAAAARARVRDLEAQMMELTDDAHQDPDAGRIALPRRSLHGLRALGGR